MPSAVITGASTGIGRASALALDARGWRVFAGVRKETDGESLRAEASERLIPVLVDVTEAEAISAMAERVASEVGGSGLDGLVNNAGVGLAGPLETLPIEDFRRQIEVNLTGQVAVTQALLPHVRAAQGRIVLISSIGGRMALPFNAAYHASKFGIEAIGDSLRQELSPWGIGVILVEPGAVATPIWETGRRAAEEMAERVPVEQEKLYGVAIERFREAVRKTEERGIAPEKVARVVVRALTARKPRTRYLVGADAQVQARLRRLLGDRLFDRLVARELRR